MRNRILAALPVEEYAELGPLLEPVKLEQGARVYRNDGAVRHVYFPEGALLSLLSTLEDGTSIEVGALGREGVGGLSALLGADAAAHTGLVQVGGPARRMGIEEARVAFGRQPHFRAGVLRYARMLLALISQTAACNTLHTVEQRLARWLLMCSRRMESERLQLTQEFLSHMLGVRRSGVTVACGVHERAGLISHSRGRITITDAQGLRRASCECAKVMGDEFDDLLAGG